MQVKNIQIASLVLTITDYCLVVVLLEKKEVIFREAELLNII